jgi:hypothetical protein
MDQIMFSFVIPTMYKSDKLLKLIKILENCNLVDEIIIIENAYQNSKILEEIDYSFFSKIKLLPQKENIYVNPAWNLGVKNSSNNYIALCNDDIFFNPIILKEILYYLENYPIGFIGMDSSQFQVKFPPVWYGIRQTDTLCNGWGTLICFKKENYIPIPKDLKVYFGDNYLIDYSKYPCYTFYGNKIHTNMSETAKTVKNIKEITLKESIIYEKKYKIK